MPISGVSSSKPRGRAQRDQRYDSATIWLHWLTVAVVILGIANASYMGFDLHGVLAMPRFGNGDPGTERSINTLHEWAANLIVLIGFFTPRRHLATNISGAIAYSCGCAHASKVRLSEFERLAAAWCRTRPVQATGARREALLPF
jgi:cytochrome b561